MSNALDTAFKALSRKQRNNWVVAKVFEVVASLHRLAETASGSAGRAPALGVPLLESLVTSLPRRMETAIAAEPPFINQCELHELIVL